jgi:succinate dehydrogenase / fumarate reductase membrane anchor subunit
MAVNITSLSGNGLRDWLVQRVSAVVLMFYTVYLLVYLACHSPMDYVMWQSLFASHSWKIFTVITLLAVLVHTWIGLWTVLGDYVKYQICGFIPLRLLMQASIFLLLLGYCVWGLLILWGG